MFFGCAAKPSVSLKDLGFISQNQKLPLNAVIVFPEEFQNKVFEGSVGQTMGARIEIGQSSVETFKKVLPSCFEKISFITDSSIPSNYHIMVIPEITTASVSTFNKRTGHLKSYVRYKMSFFDLDQNPITEISVGGTGYVNLGFFSGPAFWGGMTLGVGAPILYAKAVSKGFSEAQAEAVGNLNDNLLSAPELLAYSAKMKGKGKDAQFSQGEDSHRDAETNQSPELAVIARLEEPSGNYTLDAGEKGNLLVRIENRGKGDAGFVQIDITSSGPTEGISYEKHHFIKNIPAGKSITKEIPLIAANSLYTQQVKLQVQVKELNGFECKPESVVFQTRELHFAEAPDTSVGSQEKGEEKSDTSEYAIVSPQVQNYLISSEPNPKKWAVIIGISEYENSGETGLGNLIFADDDAKAFAQTLRKLGWSEDHMKILIDEKATERNIKIALNSWLTKAGPDDQVILFWAGHGYPDPENPEKVYLATYDTNIFIPVTGYRMNVVRKALEEIGSKNVILIADTCHAGKFITRGNGERGISVIPNITKMMREQKIPKGWVFMVGADTDRHAIEHTSWSNGAFTHSLIKGLNGEADGFQSAGAKDGIVTMGELKDYMKTAMPDETQKILGVAKHPVITTSTGDPDIWNLTLQVLQ